MAKSKSKKGGSKLSRSEIVGVRLDPKLKYAAELAARDQKRTLSSFIEWAIEEATTQHRVSRGMGQSINDVVVSTWDVDPMQRFVRLAAFHPELLSYPEQALWRTIQNTGIPLVVRDVAGCEFINETLFPALASVWEDLQAYAEAGIFDTRHIPGENGYSEYLFWDRDLQAFSSNTLDAIRSQGRYVTLGDEVLDTADPEVRDMLGLDGQ